MSRKLDFAETASIDIVSLNNKVVLMRPVIHTAKYQIVQKLVRHLRHLRKKKGSEEQLAENKRRVDRIVEDMNAMKKLRHSRISKFALANTLTFDQICKQPGCTAETRALGRFANHKAMKKAVDKFREEHPDWKSLAEFLLSHVPRRFNKNKHQFGEENIEAGNQLIKSYLQNKIPDSDIKVEKKDKNKDTFSKKVDSKNRTTCLSNQNEKKLTKDDSDKKQLVNNDKKINETIATKIKNTSVSMKDKKDGCSSDLKTTVDIFGTNDSNEKSEIQNIIEDYSNSDQYDGDEPSSSENIESGKNSENSDLDHSHFDNHIESSDQEESESESEVQEESENVINEEVESESEGQEESAKFDKVKGEMVVKKLNMEELISGNDVDVPEFLISHPCEDDVTHKKKSKDSFFMHGESDDSESENLAEDDDDSDSDDEKFPVKRTSINSSFIGALNEEKPKKNRIENNDREERVRGINSERRGRGRGQFGDRRGNGRVQSNSMRGNERSQFNNVRGRGRGNIDDRRGKAREQFGNRGGRGQDRLSNSSHRGRGEGKSFDNPQKQKNFSRQEDSSIGSKDVSKTTDKIHPSWEASKKRKEHASIQAFQGKKIKFDDD